MLNLAHNYDTMVDGSITPTNRDDEVRDPTVVKTKGAPKKKSFGS